MTFFTETVIALLCVLIFLFIFYIKWVHQYWVRRKVPYIEPRFFAGNLNDVFQGKHGVNFVLKYAYDEFKNRGNLHGGIYLLVLPVYIPINPELIKNILSKDFQHFHARGLHYDAQIDPLSGHLFNLDGDPWRNMRVKLTPTFTSGKMKMMFRTLLDCGTPMINYINNTCEDGKYLDIKEIVSCYTTDIIGSCAFGVECNSFKDPNAEFRTNGRRIISQTLSRTFKRFLTFVMPSSRKFMYERSVSTDIENFFVTAIKNIVHYRQMNKVNRNDFVQLLMEINEKVETNESLTVEEMAAQAFVFFIAGFETSSTTMTFCLHELAFNQEIQDKVRDEIRVTMDKCNGELTYDGIMGMKYMDQVINETLRKHPPVPLIMRRCTNDYKVAGTDITIEAGTYVFVSVLGLHGDKDYYPEPDIFNPERFNEENKKKRHHYVFLPFGEGPRICIGLRFGLMQVKTGLSLILNKYKILPTDTSNYKVNYCPKSFILTSREPLMLIAEKV